VLQWEAFSRTDRGSKYLCPAGALRLSTEPVLSEGEGLRMLRVQMS
jgi:hypothetical protein